MSCLPNTPRRLSELGRGPGTAELIRGMAHVKAYYMNDRTGAIELLDRSRSTPVHWIREHRRR